MFKSIVGQNALTVMFTKPSVGEELQQKMFFDPYSRNPTTQYQGTVVAILPGYDATDSPQIMIRPQRTAKNIHYIFKESEQESKTVDFWIQDQYFVDDVIKPYHCFNCQMFQLYFSGNKVVFHDTKADVKPGQSYNCQNPMCSMSLTFLGIVKILELQSAII